DPDLVAERLEHVEIGVRAALDSAGIAEQRAREADGGAALPHAGRAVEEVRVRRALGEGGVEQAPGLGLLRKALEAWHAPPLRSPLSASSRRGSRSVCRRSSLVRGRPCRPRAGTPRPPARCDRMPSRNAPPPPPGR